MAALDDVDNRVKEVIDLMLSGEWYPGKALELADRYGCAVKTVQDWSRQAGRILRMCRGSDEEFRERLLANLEYAGRLSLKLKRTWIGKDGEPFETEVPDVKAYISAQAEQAKLLRLDKPKDEGGGTEQVPIEELAAALRALGHEVILHERPEPEPAPTSAAGGEPERGEGRKEGGGGSRTSEG